MRIDLISSVRFSNQSVRLMCAVLGDYGIDPPPLIARAGIVEETLDDVTGEVSGVQELSFQHEFAEATKHQPEIWFRTGERYRLMTYGPLGLAVLSAGTVRAGLKVLEAFQALTFSLLRYSIVEEDGEVLGLIADDSNVEAGMRRFNLVRALGSATIFLRDMRQPFPLQAIETRLPELDYGIDFEEELGVPIKFNSDRSIWLFEKGAGDLSLPMASELLEKTYQQLCERLIKEAQVNDDFIGRLYAYLVRSTRHYPTAADAAAEFSISERTLNRRLAKESMSYGDVLAQVRHQHATYMLDRSALSVEAISEMLGYAETASFSRAFKRWAGMPPSRYRQRPR